MSDDVKSDELKAVELREIKILEEMKGLKKTNERLEKRVNRFEEMVSNMVEERVKRFEKRVDKDIEKIKQVAGRNYDDIGLLAQKIKLPNQGE